MSGHLTIGHVAKAAGVNVETIRYYQRRGLVDEPCKPIGGHRRYAPSAVARVRFIKCAQQLGFALQDVICLLQLEGDQRCLKARRIAEHKLALIEGRIVDLNRMRGVLKGLLTECAANQQPGSCPIIETLSANTEMI